MGTPQQDMMTALAQALDDCAQDVIAGNPINMSAKAWRAVGRMQGIAIGCRAIADLAREDDPTPSRQSGGGAGG